MIDLSHTTTELLLQSAALEYESAFSNDIAYGLQFQSLKKVRHDIQFLISVVPVVFGTCYSVGLWTSHRLSFQCSTASPVLPIRALLFLL